MKNKTNKTTAELKFKLSNAVTLGRWLNQLPLQGQASRKRTQFVSMLSNATALVDQERIKLLTQYAKKVDGVPQTYFEDNVEKYDIDPADEKKFNEELNAFLSREYSLILSEDNLPVFNYIKKIVEDTDYKFNGQLADEYNDWMTAFENA